MQRLSIRVLAGDCENKVSGPYWSTLNFVSSLIEIGFDVILDGSYKNKVSREYRKLECKQLHFHKRLWSNGILSTYYIPSKKDGVDVIISPFLLNIALFTSAISNLIRRKKARYIISIRGETYALNKFKIFYSKVLLFILGHHANLHFLSRREADLFFEKVRCISTYVIAGNGVTNYPPFQSPLDRSIEYAVFSRIHPDKGVKRALEIFGKDISVFGKASTHTERSFLNSLMMDFSKQVFLGPVSNEEKFLKLAQIKYVIFLTKREGFPMLLLDALVSGCRLVTTVEANVPDDLNRFVLIVDAAINRADLEALLRNHNWDEKGAYNYVLKNYQAKHQTRKIIDKCLQ